MTTKKRNSKRRYTEQELLAELGDQVWRAGDFRRRGISHQRRQRLVQQGLLRQLGKGVFCAPATTGIKMLRGLQRCFPNLVFGGRTARELWQNQEITLPLSVHVKHGSRMTPRAGLFQVRAMRRVPVLKHQGVRVTPPCWSLGDTPKEQETFVEEQYAGTTGTTRLARDTKLRPHMPQHLRNALDACAIGADSILERRVFHGLQTRGLKFQLNGRLFGYKWDLMSRRHRILVEVDGYEYHSSREQFIQDRWKADTALVQGWLVLRFSGSCVRYHLARVLEMIQHAVGLRRSQARTQHLDVDPPWLWHELIDAGPILPSQ